MLLLAIANFQNKKDHVYFSLVLNRFCELVAFYTTTRFARVPLHEFEKWTMALENCDKFSRRF